jgi:hypothetical protein
MTLTNPPEVREQRKAEFSLQLVDLEKKVNTIAELFERTT